MVSIYSCKKGEDTLTQDATFKTGSALEAGPIVTVSVYRGTRKQKKTSGTVSDDPCTGKSICLVVDASSGITAVGPVIGGGPSTTGVGETLDFIISQLYPAIPNNDETYLANFSATSSTSLKVSVPVEHISPNQIQTVFAGGVFQAEEFDIPVSVAQKLGYRSFTIAPGAYPVTNDGKNITFVVNKM